MKNHLLNAVAMIALIALSGCTTMQEMRLADVDLADLLETGDHVVVYTRSGQIIDMRFVLIEGDVMRGSLIYDGLEAVEVRLGEIEKIEAERIAAGRTAAAVLGGVVLAPIAAVGAGMVLAEQ